MMYHMVCVSVCVSSSDHSSMECSSTSSCWGGLAWYI